MALGGRYRLVRLIAIGGMGEVWVAHDESLARDVAVKVLKEEFAGNEDFLDRLRTEARNSAALSHSNIAQLYDYGEQQGSGYLVMELIQGEPMSDLLEREPVLPVLRLLSILSQTARALHAAHVAGVVHRDVKPGNILLERGGDVKITDFGVSLAANQVPMTAAGMVMGTAQYLSPEQAIGKAATGASDIYALGIVAYESIQGNRPFTGATPVDIAIAQVNETVPPLPATVHAGFADLIMRMLEKDPLDRPRSGAILARNFDLLAQEIAADPWGSGLRRRSDDRHAGKHGDRAALTGDALAGPAPRRAQTTPQTPVAGGAAGSGSPSRPFTEPAPTTRASARIAAERRDQRGALPSTPTDAPARPLAGRGPSTPVGERPGMPVPPPVPPPPASQHSPSTPPSLPATPGARPRDEASTLTPPALRAAPRASQWRPEGQSAGSSADRGSTGFAGGRPAGGQPRRADGSAYGAPSEGRTRATLHSEQRPTPDRARTPRPRQTTPVRPRDGSRTSSRATVTPPPPRRTSTTTGLRIGRLGWPTLALVLLILIVLIATIVKAFADDGRADPSAQTASDQPVTVSVQFTSGADLDGMIFHVTGSKPSSSAPPTTPKDT